MSAGVGTSAIGIPVSASIGILLECCHLDAHAVHRRPRREAGRPAPAAAERRHGLAGQAQPAQLALRSSTPKQMWCSPSPFSASHAASGWAGSSG